MSREQLRQSAYLVEGELRGERWGDYEVLNLSSTSIRALESAGLLCSPPAAVTFTCTVYKPPRSPAAAKPDRVYCQRVGTGLRPVAIAEFKDPSALRTPRQILSAQEQAIWHALALGVDMAIVTDGENFSYFDPAASAASGKPVAVHESRPLAPAVLAELLAGGVIVRDPKPLAESVWQLIWHATKAEPKECLLTFVEIFMLKFLSDNLASSALPADYQFDRLLADPADFLASKGVTQIEYYVDQIRPRIRSIFADSMTVDDPAVLDALGLDALSSPTSIINGFAFLRAPRSSSGSTYNRVFCEILHEFEKFGTLTAIEPEFKLRLYETFLRKSARQQRLGQFFTPRNLVRPMIRMAQLNRLREGSIVLDPAAGVGGFLLETLLFADALPSNVTFDEGLAHQAVRLVGIDVDEHTNILAKANMLLHLAEDVRETERPDALNQALVNTFLLMNENEALGALLQPPRDSVDVILTNPPYVTQGSSIYRRELEGVRGARNGVNLADYYDTGGLGVEALFMRYIAGALKPGTRIRHRPSRTAQPDRAAHEGKPAARMQRACQHRATAKRVLQYRAAHLHPGP